MIEINDKEKEFYGTEESAINSFKKKTNLTADDARLSKLGWNPDSLSFKKSASSSNPSVLATVPKYFTPTASSSNNFKK